MPNIITISLGVQEYTFDAPLDENDDPITITAPLNISVATPTIFFPLQPYTNMCRMNTTGQAGGDLIFKVDDFAIQ